MAGDSFLDGVTAVVGVAPAAVVLVDLATRQVVHANPVARQLAPAVDLPVLLDDWSDAAQLRDPSGAELSETDHPLSRIARSLPVDGQAVSAAEASAMGGRREPLWMIGLPLEGAPMLEGHALVVLLPVRGGVAADVLERLGREQALLRDRAVLATGLSFTVADALSPDQPLVWVNPAFTRTTGYDFESAVGRNCRFLQGEGTDQAVVRDLRAALDRGEAITTTLLNYRLDGTSFWNELTISPIHGPDGELTHFVGIQADVSGRVALDLAREAALSAEQRARADAEAAEARLRLMVEATTRLSGSLDVVECRQRLVELVVPDLADWLLVLHVDDHGSLGGVTAAHRDPAQAADVAELGRALPRAVREGPLEELILAGAPSRRLLDLDGEDRRADRSAYLRDIGVLERTAALGAGSALIVPLPGRRRHHDLLVLVRTPERAQFSEQDLEVAVDLGRRAGLILDNAHLFSTQQLIAETLQRSLLPDLPKIEGVEVAARYLAGQFGAEVGGDFYELIELPDHTVGLAIGDVIGHDVLAAAAMGHLKGLLRACAYDDATFDSPARVLERVDQLVAGLGMPTIATAAYAQLRPDADAWVMTLSNAGHPPLVVRHPDGRCEFVAGEADVLLGVVPGPRHQAELRLEPGSVVVGYTDGLVERRGELIDAGLERLLVSLAAAPPEVEALCDHLVADLAGTNEDDVAVIAVRLGSATDRAAW